MSEQQQQQMLIDFDKMSFQEKREQIICSILMATNFTDAFVTTLDWSTSSMQLHVPSTMVLHFLRRLDFDRICSLLVGKKHLKKCLKLFLVVFREKKKWLVVTKFLMTLKVESTFT